jgi:hypothetical protein
MERLGKSGQPIDNCKVPIDRTKPRRSTCSMFRWDDDVSIYACDQDLSAWKEVSEVVMGRNLDKEKLRLVFQRGKLVIRRIDGALFR